MGVSIVVVLVMGVSVVVVLVMGVSTQSTTTCVHVISTVQGSTRPQFK